MFSLRHAELRSLVTEARRAWEAHELGAPIRSIGIAQGVVDSMSVKILKQVTHLWETFYVGFVWVMVRHHLNAMLCSTRLSFAISPLAHM
jgi:hypothetical protein